MDLAQVQPLCPPDPAHLGYTFVRHVGLVLDELSSQGLELWVNEQGTSYWRWRGTSLVAVRGFWALGEALVDAVITRYPESFTPVNHETTSEFD